jgi:hypothetical protein
MLYFPKHFAIQELVPKHIFIERGPKAIELLDQKAVATLDQLRERFGSLTVNDWFWGGPNQWRGLRTAACTIGAKYSQHNYGRAFDCSFGSVTSEEVRKFVLANPDAFPFINFVELDTPHFHFDTRNCNRITTWSPKT